EPVATLINLTKLVMFDFHFIRTSCFFGTDNPVLYFVGRLLTCPVACALLLCAWVLQKMLGRHKPFNTVLNQCGVMIFAFFLSITRATLIPFQCVENPNGTSSMMLHPGIICYQSEEHALFAALSVVGVVTQPLAILVLATYVIFTYPSRVAGGKGLRFSTRYRFLLHRFKPSSYYYGLVLLYRNAIIALLPTVLVGVPEVQVPLMGIMLLAVQNLSLQTAPWRTQMANRVDMLLTDLLLVTLLSAGPLLLLDEASSTAVLGWLLCVPILSILLVVLLGFLRLAVKAIRQKREKLYDIFLCHHKAGGGSLSRLMKLVILQHSSARVFLDSDQLQNLDLLFDIIRTSTKNVVVVLTGELLSRSWCAGEIVTAWKNDIHTVPLLCEGFERLSDEAQKQIPSLWTPHQVAQLASYGIQLDDVNLAYSWLQHELTPLQMARFGPVCGREKVVVELMNVCGLSSRRTTSKTAGHVSRPRILILSSYMEAEYLSACEVFQILLQAHLHVECEVVHDFQQIATCKPFAYYLIALLFRGILRDEDFIKLLLYATQTCTSSKRALELVPVVADSNFEVPNVDGYWAL
ncbi:Tg, partial [Symbiodinium sp. CCMP2592]